MEATSPLPGLSLGNEASYPCGRVDAVNRASAETKRWLSRANDRLARDYHVSLHQGAAYRELGLIQRICGGLFALVR